jgi:hypothetical protein
MLVCAEKLLQPQDFEEIKSRFPGVCHCFGARFREAIEDRSDALYTCTAADGDWGEMGKYKCSKQAQGVH